MTLHLPMMLLPHLLKVKKVLKVLKVEMICHLFKV
jgi:hypothetical protein